MRLFAVLFFCLTAPAVPAKETHGIFEATYDAKIKIAGGQVRLATRRNDDGSYTFQYQTIPGKLIRLFTKGELTETTIFEVVDGRPRTLDYTLINTLGSKPRNGHVVFDWDKRMVIGNYKDQFIDTPIPDNAVDRAMLQLLLMADMRNGELKERYFGWNKNEFLPMLVEKTGRETIETRLGTFEADILRYAEEGGDAVTTIWLAEELGYLPVRIQAHDEGSKVLDAHLIAVQGSPAG